MKIRETISRQVIDPETRKRWISIAYMALTCAMLLHHVYVTMYFATVESGAIPFRFLWIFLAGATFFLGRMWKDPCSWLLTVLLLMKFLRIAIPMPEEIREIQTIYELCVYAFFLCYGAGRALNAKDRKTLVKAFCGLWTAAMTVYACIGLYTVWTGTVVHNLGTKSFYIHASEERLWPIYHPVEAGTLTAVSIGVALAGFFLTERKALRVLYIPAGILIFLTGAFCVSRTGYVLTAAGISAALCVVLVERVWKKPRKGFGFTLLRLAAACAVFAALTLGLILIQQKMVPAYTALRSRGGLISTAAAEAVDAGTELGNRAFVTDEGADGFLTGRLTIWIHVCSGMDHYPIYLLIGQGVLNPMEHINGFIRYGNGMGTIYHLHSTFIQTLWESGIPGFLVFTAFFGFFAWNALRLITDRSAPLWQRMIPIPAMLCWLADLVDCTGYCNFGKPPMTILYFFTGLTIAIARERRKKKKQTGAEKA